MTAPLNMHQDAPDFSAAIAAVQKIESVPLILEMVKQATGMRFAAVARVTDRHWVTCAVDDSIDFGLIPGSHLELETTICHEIRQNRKPVIFTQASSHPLFSVHHTPQLYGLESYVSIPIVTADGQFFGTLCAIDPAPARFDESTVLKTMGLYAQLIAMNLDLHKDLLASGQALEDAHEVGVLREQFVAVLAHDLRTPLSAVRLSAELLETRVNEPNNLKLIRAVRQSAVRMGVLIEDVLDFARGELGGGIPIKPVVTDTLQEQFEAVLTELRVVHPCAVILDTLSIPTGLNCDPGRLGQLLVNLVDNAITHGAKGEPVVVHIHTVGQSLVLSVHNRGVAIPEAVQPGLFHPFKRHEVGSRKDGLGLGLYIANEICAGHRGTLEVTSNDAHGTEFVATLPC
ncbi:MULTISPECIES: GAF domain-containing sensor histidine kinase [unclassified Pseudomonas]|uniref:GAF domain-containing sensor histidine kinase n=1 Tax=unclassified Pseudomonas TaxID=196821 RepID=UPI001E654513|nr:GAF domain-containing sensor histidine kinase [Pseudomonas sp. Bi70]